MAPQFPSRAHLEGGSGQWVIRGAGEISGFDVGTAAVLAAVVLLEGIRRIQPGTIVLRAFGTAGFQPESPRAGLHLVSWCSPFVTTVVLAPPTAPAAELSLEDGRARVATVNGLLAVLRPLAAIAGLGLVLGVPLAIAASGTHGLLLACLALLLIAIETVILAATALEMLGLDGRTRLRRVLPLLSPFAAPRAPEVLLEEALRPFPPLVAASLLLSGDAYRRWVRPIAYDALAQPAIHDMNLILAIPRPEWPVLVESPPDDPQSVGYCPRCGAAYRVSAGDCADCRVALRRAALPGAG